MTKENIAVLWYAVASVVLTTIAYGHCLSGGDVNWGKFWTINAIGQGALTAVMLILHSIATPSEEDQKKRTGLEKAGQ